MEAFKSILVTAAEALLFLLFGKHAGEFGGQALDRWAAAVAHPEPHRPGPVPLGHHRHAS